MKKVIFVFVLLFSIFSCKKSTEVLITQENEYAKNFSIEIKNDEKEITSAGVKVQFPKDFKIKRCIITGTSASAYIDALDKLNTVIGVCSPHYFYNPKIAKGIENGSIQDIGNDATLNFEKIISLKPDIIITTHNSSYEKILSRLSETGVKIMYIEEYMEFHPLGKTEYLKLFGALFEETPRADSLYNSIKTRYLSLHEKTQSLSGNKPTVFTNIMYGDSWYMAGGQSFIATLFKDAGADYIWQDSPQTGSINLSFEEVFSKAKNADYWIGASNFNSKQELLSANPYYKWFDAYKNNRIYTMNEKENELKANDYYESGSLYSDKALADVVKIIYPFLLPDYELTYFKKLE